MATCLADYRAGALHATPEISWRLARAVAEDVYRAELQERLEETASGSGWDVAGRSLADILDELSLEPAKEDVVDEYGRQAKRKPRWKFWRKK